MTAVAGPDALRPCLRPDVRLGPPLMKGTATVHFLKDERTGWYFQVGEREFFVISRLDGERTLDQLGHDYADRFGRRLGPGNWGQIMGLLGTRRLLVGSGDDAQLDTLAAAAKQRNRKDSSLLKYRIPVLNPDGAFTRWEPRLRVFFSPYFVLPALVAILALLACVVLRPVDLFTEARAGLSRPPLLVATLVLVWLSLALHETAHGVTCKHFGGRAPEIGVLWRFPILAPYCKADDVILFARRRHRVYTAFAGIFVNLVVVLPFGALWLFAAPGSTPRTLGAEVVLLAGAAGVMNLIPFLQLDGYHMLNHALGAADLRNDAFHFCRTVVRGLVRRGPSGIGGYPRGRRWAYGLYALGSLGYGLWLLLRMVIYIEFALRAAMHPTAAVLVVFGIVALGIALAVVDRRLQGRRRAAVVSPFEANGEGAPG